MSASTEHAEGQPSESAGNESRGKGKLVRLAFTVLALLISITLSANRLSGEISDRGDTAPDSAFALQAACANAGFSSDADGRCYNTDPRGLAEVELAAARVPPPVQAPGAPAESPEDGPVAPVAPPLVVPAAPIGSQDNPRPVSPASDDTTGPVPAQPGSPDAPVQPGSPASPGAPLAPGTPASPSSPNSNTPTGADRPINNSNDPQPVVVRETIRVTLPFGLDPDPQPVGMTTTGGVVDVGAAAAGCTGWAGSDPDIVLTYTDANGSEAGTSGQPLRIFFEASSGEPFNASIIVNDPYGRWWCNDDWETGKPDPMLTFLDAGYGVYDIWVGAPARGTGPGGIVFITERPINPRG